MKVDRKSTESLPAQPPKVPFRTVMKQKLATSAGTGSFKGAASKTQLSADRARSQKTVTQTVSTARQAIGAEASRLVTGRSESFAHDEELGQQRTHDLIAQELSKDLNPSPATPLPLAAQKDPRGEPPSTRGSSGKSQVDASGSPGVPATAAKSSAVDAAMALVEKIEVFVKSQRPGLSLTVGGGLSAEVTVEKTGPRCVSLSIRGQGGPVDPAKLVLVQRQMAARGLSITSLTAA